MISIDIEIIKNDLLQSIANKFNIPYNDLLLILNNVSKTRIIKSKYSCNHNFFCKNNENSFYWAGFIAADGCVFNKDDSKTLIISLSEKDYNHLLSFKNIINYNGPLHKSITHHSKINAKWKDSIKRTLRISSFQIFEDLKRFNINPNKTKTYTFPKWLINHELVNHFMRGYNDGDGSFYFDSSRNRVCFELRGNVEFLNDYKKILELNFNKKSLVNVTIPDSTAKLKYTGKKIVPQIFDFLYKDATIYLPRKYNIGKLSKNLIKRD